MSNFPLWAARLYNVPVALDRLKNDVICEVAEQRILGGKPDKINVATLEGVQLRSNSDEASFYSDGNRKPFLHRGNIAVVPVRGTLVQRGDFMDAESGMLGYNRILDTMKAASSDDDIKGIFMPYDSGGGETAGMFAAAEQIATMSKAEGGKPIFVYLDERACSAAYMLACAGDRIFGRRESLAGSIASIINMVDKSKAFEKLGLEAVVVRASWADHKALGQAGERIDPELVKKALSLVEDSSNQMVEFVAAMRGISEKSIRDLRGEFFQSSEAVGLGLVDEIATEKQAWAALEREIAGA